MLAMEAEAVETTIKNMKGKTTNSFNLSTKEPHAKR